MILSRLYRIPLVAIVSVLILLTTGCGGGGNDTTVPPLPPLPTEAVAFNTSNAWDVINAALVLRRNLGLATRDDSGIAIVTKCSAGGTMETSSSGTRKAKNGITKFFNCNFDNVVVIDGSFSFHIRINKGNVIYAGSGELFIVNLADSNSFKMSMNFRKVRIPSTGHFSRSENYSVLDSSLLGGFIVEIKESFEGNYLTNELGSGIMLIHSSNNTSIRITVIATNTASVELDDGSGGGFIEITGSPIIIMP
jgi:hypothetical protein